MSTLSFVATSGTSCTPTIAAVKHSGTGSFPSMTSTITPNVGVDFSVDVSTTSFPATLGNFILYVTGTLSNGNSCRYSVPV